VQEYISYKVSVVKPKGKSFLQKLEVDEMMILKRY
jgi:hypothetical protein